MFRVHQWAMCYEATVTLSVNKVLKCGWRVTHGYNNHMQIWVNKQRDIWALYPKEIKYKLDNWLDRWSASRRCRNIGIAQTGTCGM